MLTDGDGHGFVLLGVHEGTLVSHMTGEKLSTKICDKDADIAVYVSTKNSYEPIYAEDMDKMKYSLYHHGMAEFKQKLINLFSSKKRLSVS